jgi:hypothetical protein
MHRGSVEVTSRLGAGTTFRVVLPADPRRDDVAAATEGEATVAAAKMVDSSPTGRPSLNRESSG